MKLREVSGHYFREFDFKVGDLLIRKIQEHEKDYFKQCTELIGLITKIDKYKFTIKFCGMQTNFNRQYDMGLLLGEGWHILSND